MITSYTPFGGYIILKREADQQYLKVYKVVESPTGNPTVGDLVMINEAIPPVHSYKVGDVDHLVIAVSAVHSIVTMSSD